VNSDALWNYVTALGDSSVLLPAAAIIAAWLLAQRGLRRVGAWWVVTYAAAVVMVSASKILYMGWGISPPGLDFVGLSGHSALSILVWTTLGAFLSSGLPGRWRWAGPAAGLALATVISVSRVELGAHTPSEAVAGVVVGGGLLWAFLRRAHVYSARPHAVALLLAALAVPLFVDYGDRFPSTTLLARVAEVLSGHNHAHTRAELERMLGMHR